MRRLMVLFRRLMTFAETMGLDPRLGISALVLSVLVVVFTVFWFVKTAPPDSITMISGPEGSMFQRNAEKYRKVLARSGIKLEIVPSQGSLENLVHLSDPSFRIDVGFVQGGLIQDGLAQGLDTTGLISLGSVFYEPLLVFYRGKPDVTMLSQFKGKRLATGQVGSGTLALATALLKANGIEPGGLKENGIKPGEANEFIESNPEDSADALIAGRVDAVFLMGDSASGKLMGKLMRAPGIQVLDFQQASAYTRRITYLNKLELPEGAIDLGKNIPARDVSLVAPTVELVARNHLHPALSDLLLEAAHEVNGRATLFQHQGEFPAPLQHEFRISDDAERYYKSGKSFLYRNLPFWLASIVNRVLVVIVPLLVVLIPALRMLPSVYRWRMRSRITKSYGALLELEKDLLQPQEPAQRAILAARLDTIERTVHRTNIPHFFGDQFYVLLQHVDYMRSRLREPVQQAVEQ